MTRRTFAILLLILAPLVALAFLPRALRRPSPTDPVEPNAVVESDAESPRAFRIAFVSFPDSDALIWRDALRETTCEFASYPREEFLSAPLEEFDLVVLRAIGWRPTEEERARAASLVATTRCVGHTQTLDFAREATNLDADLVASFAAYLGFPCEENARRGAALVARELAGRELRFTSSARKGETLEVKEAVAAPSAGFFYWGAEISSNFEEFKARRAAEGRPFEPDAPRVALFGDFLDPFKEADRRPVNELIGKLEDRGFYVCPIYRFQNDVQTLKDCRPDVCVYFPRGRALADGTAPDLFAELDAPVLTAALLTGSEEEWRSEPIGSTGSFYSLATALPELDGAIEPLAIGVKEEDASGLTVRKPLSERIDALVARVQGWVDLRRKANAQKRIAIFYYKSPGASALTAQSLEVVDSLYNVLTRLRREGYDLGNEFPSSSEELGAAIASRGRTIGQWNLGDFTRFVADSEPALVPEELYSHWFKTLLSAEAQLKTLDAWGAPPGEVMTADVGDEYGLVVPRLVFGNVALLPQPSTSILVDAPYSEQGNELDAVHGTGKAPPHFYFAAYFWAREEFGADAIVHFGTHGSLEFSQGKTGFLTESCFPDALIGNKPHVYLYSINNVGEAILAKRRARATLVSHLTPPFVKSGLYGDLATLDEKIHAFEDADEPLLRAEIAKSIVELTLRSDVVDDLLEDRAFAEFADADARARFLADGRVFSDEQLHSIHKLLHRLENVDVADGLHVLGRPWSGELVASTAAASTLDEADAAERLRASFDLELDRFTCALSGRFVPPSSGGDFLVNPDSAPTGRNLSGLDVQKLPSAEAERVAARLTDELLDSYRSRHDGATPRKVACTLWGGETTRTQGVGVAQALYLMGARVKRDGRGNASGVELIPSDELGRARIDVLAQTSGQFRDSFLNCIELLDAAARLASDAEGEAYPNYVREHSLRTAERLVESGVATVEEARELSTARVFGATNSGSYGTGIMRLIERGDMWETDDQIADRYLANMSGVYRSAEDWGKATKGLLEYNLEGLDLTVQTRSSNTWGPAKLDHVYEFAVLATAARAKTGRDPEMWFDDLRSPTTARVETARAAMREELRSTLWNPKYLQGLQREGASAAESVAKTTMNLFGWSVAQPKMVDASIWEETKAVLIDDARGIGAPEWLERANPAALQNMTAVMLEAIRKGRWDASPETTQSLAALHARLVADHGSSGSYESTGNVALRRFVADLAPDDLADRYAEAIARATVAPNALVDGLALEETRVEETPVDKGPEARARVGLGSFVAVALIFALAFLSGVFAPIRRIVG